MAIQVRLDHVMKWHLRMNRIVDSMRSRYGIQVKQEHSGGDEDEANIQAPSLDDDETVATKEELGQYQLGNKQIVTMRAPEQVEGQQSKQPSDTPKDMSTLLERKVRQALVGWKELIGVALQFPEFCRSLVEWVVQSLTKDSGTAPYQAAVKKGAAAGLPAWSKALNAGPFLIQKTKEAADRQWVAVLGPVDQDKARRTPDISVNAFLIKVVADAATPHAALGVTKSGSQ